MDRKELRSLSALRLREAQVLLSAGLSDGAYYLAGYAVECAVKACIAKATKRFEFPDKKRVDLSYSHNLRDLVRIAGLEELRSERASKDLEFRKSWDTVQSWSEQSRYARNDQAAAEDLVKAIADKPDGILAWLRLHW